MSQSANTIEYLIRRRSDMSVGAKVTVEVVEPGRRLDLDSLSRLLVERYVMFGGSSNRLNTATAEHPPWTLHRARVRSLDGRLLPAAGLADPGSEEVAHWSPGVRARISRP